MTFALAVLLWAAPPGMALVPAGEYHPFFLDTLDGGVVRPEPVPVRAFLLDVRPVTAGEFLEFVRQTPRWRRSAVPRLFADERYLERWEADLAPPAAARPVTQVSWFAAKAFCAWSGKRLPTTAEWELALDDRGRHRDEVTRRILEWYQAPPADPPAAGSSPTNELGLRDLVGVVWEWTLDFNDAMTSDESRAGETSLFCGSGGARASAPGDSASLLRYGFRTSLEASYTVKSLGFRCARSLP